MFLIYIYTYIYASICIFMTWRVIFWDGSALNLMFYSVSLLFVHIHINSNN